MSKEIADNYSEDDVIMVYDFAVTTSWEDAINYLTRENKNFREGIEDFIINDLIILRDNNVPFESDPHKAYNLMRKGGK